MNKPSMHTTKIDIPEKIRIEVIQLLTISLASTNDLYAQLKQAHWNIKGMQFIALHTLFDTLAEQLEDQIDIIAERITSLGGTAYGTIQETVKNSILPVYPLNIFSAQEHLEHLTHNMAILGESSRADITKSEKLGDICTGDIYIALTRFLDKSLWFLEAHLQK